MIYATQVISILFAVFLARHDAPAVNSFCDHGQNPEALAKFHSNAFRLKGAVVIGLSILILISPDHYIFKYLLTAIISGIVNSFWIWLLFDPILNKQRKRGLGWDYLGNDDGTGRWLTKHFGRNAGQIKAIGCVVVIVSLNIFYLFV